MKVNSNNIIDIFVKKQMLLLANTVLNSGDIKAMKGVMSEAIHWNHRRNDGDVNLMIDTLEAQLDSLTRKVVDVDFEVKLARELEAMR